MASSDEEGEIVPDCVTDYHFVDHKDELVSFSVLPLHWRKNEIPEDLTQNVFLRGATDGGLQQVHKKVIGWAFELSYALPEIYVLSKDKTWMKLQKPRKSFEDTIRTIEITVNCLHFVKKNPEASKDALWSHLRRAFRSQIVEPSENDLLEHIPLIRKVATTDKDIAISEYLATFLNEIEVPWKREAFLEENQTSSKSKFIDDADDYDADSDDGEDDDDKSGELFDAVCALCDNGGEVLVCEGACIRSFHPTVDTGEDSFCESLGFTNAAQYEALRTFLCDNCQYERHQCFICGMLGSSNKSTGAEVFPCVSATCGHFYHPKCVAELLYPSDGNQAEELQLQIAAGESFACPAHKCSVCKQGENKKEPDLQFAMCRRCPKAYHRKCLPRKIAFEGNNDNSIQQRAWDDLLPKRILIYCMDHKIIPTLGTPKRDHLLFPYVEREKKQQSSGLQASKEKVVNEKRSKVFGNLSESMVLGSAENNREKFPESNREKLQKLVDRRKGTAKIGDSASDKTFTAKSLKGKNIDAAVKAYKPVVMDKSKPLFKGNDLSVSGRVCNSSAMEKSKATFRSMQSSSLLHTNSHLLKSKKLSLPSAKMDEKYPAKPVMKTETSTQRLVDTEMEKRILKLMKDATSSFNVEEFKEERRRRCDYKTYSSRTSFDKTITTGKVEASVKAVRAALKKLEAGYSSEEAKVVCEPEVLKQLIRWKKKLTVYLAPFLYGMRYTSYGRHFTKLDKLKEIVNRLHWYVKDGDMLVDFCCGSNDFSCLMKEKLDEVGKRCSFKNYDLFTPANDFNYEKRDWFSVGVGELPAGSRLIMGLNPPFGVQASLANQFIDGALKFQPKLLILIVPTETKRLDEKIPPYDIIWEDKQILSGKSFYLPGSVDIHDQQLEDWNVDPPPLYLWSHPDWTAEHKRIAQKCGHLSEEQEKKQAGGVRKVVSNYLMEETHDCYGDFSNIMSGYCDISNILDDVPEEPNNGNSINGTGVMEIQIEETLDEMDVDKDLSAPIISPLICTDPRSPVGARSYGDSKSPSDMHARSKDGGKDMTAPVILPVGCTEFQSTVEARTYGSFKPPSDMHARSEGFQCPQPTSYSGHNPVFGSEYHRYHANIPYSTGIGYPKMSESAFQCLQPTSYSGHNPVFGSEYYRYHANIPYSTGIGYPKMSESASPSSTYVWPPGASYYSQSAYPSETYIQPPMARATYGQSAFSSEPDMYPPDMYPPGTSPPGAM